MLKIGYITDITVKSITYKQRKCYEDKYWINK